MKYDPFLFKIEVDFVTELSRIYKKPFLELLPKYSEALYRFNIDEKTFTLDNPVWQEFINSYFDSNKPYESFVEFMELREQTRIKSDWKVFGLFRYNVEEQDRTIRIHTVVAPTPSDQVSPINHENYQNRLNDLKEMFTEIKELHGDKVDFVRGNSWLYNIEAYKRLFPKSYSSDPQAPKTTFNGLALWGQFLDKELKVKHRIADQFLEKIKKTKSFEEIMNCFPYQSLKVKGPIKDFYDKYGI